MQCYVTVAMVSCNTVSAVTSVYPDAEFQRIALIQICADHGIDPGIDDPSHGTVWSAICERMDDDPSLHVSIGDINPVPVDDDARCLAYLNRHYGLGPWRQAVAFAKTKLGYKEWLVESLAGIMKG